MILMILDFKGRHLGVPSPRSLAKHMIFGALVGVRGRPWGPDLTKDPTGYLRFPKEKQWFCVFKGRIGSPFWAKQR